MNYESPINHQSQRPEKSITKDRFFDIYHVYATIFLFAGDLERESARLREALETISKTQWVSTIDEAMRGGNTPACAAESMNAIARAALAASNGLHQEAP